MNLVELLLNELGNRGGFDAWWGNLDDDIQTEIKTALAEIIESYESLSLVKLKPLPEGFDSQSLIERYYLMMGNVMGVEND